MLDWVKQLVESFGYVGIVVLMFLENVFPPIPSEVIMPLAGFFTVQGELWYPLVVLAGMVGSVLGALPLYYLGRWVGEEGLKNWADKHGKWLTVSRDEIEKADQWFDSHGHKAVLIARLVPGIRSLISIPAGVSGMKLPTFLIYTAIGTGLWAALLAYLGRLLGENYTLVDQYLGPAGFVVLAVLAIGGAWWVWKRKQRRAGQQEQA